jgi:hypothetical protein
MQNLSELTSLTIGSGVSSDTGAGVQVDVVNTGCTVLAWRTGAFVDVWLTQSIVKCENNCFVCNSLLSAQRNANNYWLDRF